MQFSKIIVLGSNSFTGGHFIDHILKNSQCEIIGISRSPEYHPFFLPFLYRKERPDRYTFCQLDVNKDLEEICSRCDDLKPDVIVNFAAQGEVRNSWKWSLQWDKTNCISVVRLTEHLKTKNYLRNMWRFQRQKYMVLLVKISKKVTSIIQALHTRLQN